MADPALSKKLMRAVRKGDLAEMDRLILAGADIETRGGFLSMGQTPLVHAAWHGQLEAVRRLLDRGANPNARDVIGDTALIAAAEPNKPAIARLLVERGAETSLTSEARTGSTATGIASRHKYVAVVTEIEKALSERRAKERLAAGEVKRQREEQARLDHEAQLVRDRDIVIVSRPIGDRTLQEVYNFAALDRLTLVRNGQTGPVEAVTRQNFADIGDKPDLRSAFAEHVRRGGKVSEADVFPERRPALAKPLQKPQP